MRSWALGPFELIKHAEGHRASGGDFDRRMALIGYDNAIEASIATFLSLNPMQRSGKEFQRKEVDDWLASFNKKLVFLETYVTSHLGRNMEIPKEEILFSHQLRNELYHAGNGMVPAEVHVHRARAAALWVFSILFDVDAESLLTLEDQSEKIKAPPEIEVEGLSSSTEFLNAFVQMSKDLSTLVALVGEKSDQAISEHQSADILSLNLPTELANKVKDVLSRAPGLRDEIVEERLTNEGRDQLPGLVTEINEINSGIQKRLRSYQLEAVNAAMKAALEALSSNNNDIGVVVQPAGTGLTTTLAVFVTSVLNDLHFDNYRILILSDRQVMEDQLIDIVSSNLATRLFDSRRAEGQAELISLLRHDGPRIVFATVQKLAALSTSVIEVPSSFIAIDFNVTGNWEAVEKALQHCFRIRFLNAPLVNAAGHPKIAYQYSLQDAIQGNYLTPLRVTKKSLSQCDQETEAKESAAEREFPEILSAEIIRALGAELISDLIRDEPSPLKAIALAPNRVAAVRLIEVLEHTNGEWKSRVALLTSELSQSQRAALWQEIKDEQSPVRLLVTTVGMITGIDAGVIGKIYVMTRLSKMELLGVAGLLMRQYPGKAYGEIVDYCDSIDPNDLGDW